MQRMADATLDRAGRRHQRLAEHLPAEHALRTVLGAHAPEDIDFDGFEIEQRDQFAHGIGGIGHEVPLMDGHAAAQGLCRRSTSS